MNRTKALFIADRIMTRIETDKAINKDAIADEIQAAEVIDVISLADLPALAGVVGYDKAKKCWVFRDGTPIEPEAEQVKPAPIVLPDDLHPGTVGLLKRYGLLG